MNEIDRPIAEVPRSDRQMPGTAEDLHGEDLAPEPTEDVDPREGAASDTATDTMADPVPAPVAGDPTDAPVPVTELLAGQVIEAHEEPDGMLTHSEPAGEIVLACEGLVKEFSVAGSTFRAVDDVSLSFPAASVLAVVGESGSGKSTLARMLLRLMPATSGTITYRGQDVTHIKGAELRSYWKDVQAVFQDPFASFNQFFTVGSMLRRSLKLAGVQKDEADHLIEECLGYVGLTPDKAMHKFPHQMSGGQRQRVMVARALMMRPRVLLADEATSMLDASLRVNVLNVLHDLKDDLGLTVLFITHDIGQACYLADRVVVMEKGNVVERGTTDEVIFAPQAEYTRRLLADVPDLKGSLKVRA